MNPFFGQSSDQLGTDVNIKPGIMYWELLESGTVVDVYGEMNNEMDWKTEEGWAYSMNNRAPSSTYHKDDWTVMFNAWSSATSNPASGATRYPINTFIACFSVCRTPSAPPEGLAVEARVSCHSQNFCPTTQHLRGGGGLTPPPRTWIS